MKHRRSFPHRMAAPDRHKGQTDRDKRTCLFVSLSLRWSFTHSDHQRWILKITIWTVSYVTIFNEIEKKLQ